MSVIHSFGRGEALSGPGPRFELEPGRYKVNVTDRPGETLEVKIQHCVGTVDRVEIREIPGPRLRAPRSQETVVEKDEVYEDYTVAGAEFTVDTAGVYRLFYGDGGATIGLEQMED